VEGRASGQVRAAGSVMGTPILLFLYAAGAAGIGLGLAAAANGAPGAGFAHMLPSGSKCRYQGGASSSSAASSSTRIGDGGGPVGGIAPAPSPTIRVLNAGSGTTGTTEFFALLCRYGVPSVHYSFHCNLGDNREKVLKAHREVMRLWFCFNSASVGGEVGPSPRIIHSHNCAVRLDPSRYELDWPSQTPDCRPSRHDATVPDRGFKAGHLAGSYTGCVHVGPPRGSVCGTTCARAWWRRCGPSSPREWRG